MGNESTVQEERMRHRYVGLWEGGSSYGVSSWGRHAELFETVDQAAAVLRSRYLSGLTLPGDRTHSVTWINPVRSTMPVAVSSGRMKPFLTPAVDEACSIVLAPRNTPLTALERHAPMVVTHELTIGPRGGVRIERF